jgi:TPR repeat protein
LLLWLIEADVFQLPQLHKHFNVSGNIKRAFIPKPSRQKSYSVTQTFSKTRLNRTFRLGYQLAFETKRKKKNWDDIFALWLCAGKGGHMRAQFYLGTCYDHALGTDKNIQEAFKWYLKAAKQGHMESQYNIGFFYLKGEVVKQDYKKAVHWYTLAATQGDTEAQRDLGVCYIYGTGVKADYVKAVYWYKKAASKNDPKALYNLGLCYKEGDGVNQSNRWAKHYFEQAKRFGHKQASKQLQALASQQILPLTVCL